MQRRIVQDAGPNQPGGVKRQRGEKAIILAESLFVGFILYPTLQI